ncbi:hypothetical protein GGI21_000121 [Coemansia aciculifera]|nr:hypothetical protein GGI21_000121 [Coemansia aciculifera]
MDGQQSALLAKDDPLAQILDTVGHAGPMADGAKAVEALYRLYTSSADIRACLRLVDPAYLDALTTAHLAGRAFSEEKHAEDIASGAAAVVGAGTRITRLLSEQTLNGRSDAAATMLADIMDTAPVTQAAVAQALLEHVRAGMPVLAYARLLRAADSALLRALVDAIVSNSAPHILPQLLNVAAQTIELGQGAALSVLAGLSTLRVFVRHVIKLLSEPAPAVAAPALHLLTLILLIPPTAVDSLTALADGLRGKLFDAAHIGRTLVLAADLCLNCHQDTSEDLVVLDAVAGMVAAISQYESMNGSAGSAVRAAFFASTELVPAIVHVVALAKLDRRYIHSALRMVTAIVASSSDSGTSLVCALTGEPLATSSESAVGELLELVLSGIEDIGDAVPVSQEESSKMVVVSSDEAGCCWLANCSKSNRHSVARFLSAALNCPALGDETERWAPLLADAVFSALEPFLAAPAFNPAVTMTIARYYWVVRPVLDLALDLAAESSVFRTQWQQHLARHKGPEQLPEMESMYKELADILALPLPQAASATFLCDIYNQASAKAATIITASVATPSDSSRASSGTASPYKLNADDEDDRSVIAITDMRVAAAAGEDRLPQEMDVSGRVQEAVLRQWLRTCEAEVALVLLGPSPAANLSLPDGIRQARLLVMPPGSGAFLAVAANIRRQHFNYVAALKTAVALSVQQRHDHLLASTESQLAYLSGELHRAQTQAEQLAADLGQTRKQADQWSTDHSKLRLAHDELQVKHLETATDADEWRQECIRTRDHLDRSEQSSKETLQSLLAQHEVEKKRCVQMAVDANQAAWDRRHAAMADTVAALERALADAVPRLRELEAASETERLANAELRLQNSAMASKLADMAHAATALHSIAQRPHH